MDRCAWWYCTGSGALTQPSGEGVIVDPRARALLRIQQQAEHVAAAHGVGAVVTRLPENHGMAAEGIEADLLRGAALGGGEDEAGVDHGGGCAWCYCITEGGRPLTVPTACRSSHRRRWRGDPNARRRQSSQGGDRSVRPSCTARTCPKASPVLPET